ncbi:DUF228 domain-containing protein (plasmid) [Borrelia anserina]|uniref:Uncharacterized protein n=2 Tax=Borrelia anserina TaxID=143 RepID=W5SQ19_BORAN|nr:DUF228 domain-containing protein [Borrelia anserina]AHH08972.1 Hypothetical protein BAN_0020800 [Borrelia anserina BA2]APR65364.1 hypothetical protein N187_A45 [Borrelia anserina Es]UPA07328.1 DUF228 domain-containing protein [Borrelia anserina]
MPDKSELEASLAKLTQEKSRLESELASLKVNKQASVLEKLKSYSTHPAVFDKSSQFGSFDIYFSHKGGLQYSLADKFENYQAVDFCYKRGVKLVVDNSMSPCIARGGGSDLYGICIDYDDMTKIATVISIASSFECVLLSDVSVKAGDKLVFDNEGVLAKISDNATYMQAMALSDALEFRDRPGFYGTKVMLISKPVTQI